MSSSLDDVGILMEMGFSETRAQKGLAKTGYQGIQQAMDWILAHSEDPDIDEPYTEAAGYVLGAGSNDKNNESEPGSENSLSQSTEPDVIPENAPGIEDAEGKVELTRCLDCGKLLQTDDDLNLHASRTKHVNYEKTMEKIKEMTPEEKKEQMERLQSLLKQKRIEREEKERKDHIQKEKKRRADGKDIALLKQMMQEKEMLKLAEQRKKDRLEDKLARQRVLENIKRDRLEKEEANRRAKGLSPSDESVAVNSNATTAQQPAATRTVSASPKDNTECKLMLRLSNGINLKATFSSKETLAAVRVYVMVNCKQVGDAPLGFSTAYPKRKYTEEDMQLPLNELGLVPTAVLNITVG